MTLEVRLYIQFLDFNPVEPYAKADMTSPADDNDEDSKESGSEEGWLFLFECLDDMQDNKALQVVLPSVPKYKQSHTLRWNFNTINNETSQDSLPDYKSNLNFIKEKSEDAVDPNISSFSVVII
jgi:hypothetical protein